MIEIKIKTIPPKNNKNFPQDIKIKTDKNIDKKALKKEISRIIKTLYSLPTFQIYSRRPFNAKIKIEDQKTNISGNYLKVFKEEEEILPVEFTLEKIAELLQIADEAEEVPDASFLIPITIEFKKFTEDGSISKSISKFKRRKVSNVYLGEFVFGHDEYIFSVETTITGITEKWFNLSYVIRSFSKHFQPISNIYFYEHLKEVAEYLIESYLKETTVSPYFLEKDPKGSITISIEANTDQLNAIVSDPFLKLLAEEKEKNDSDAFVYALSSLLSPLSLAVKKGIITKEDFE